MPNKMDALLLGHGVVFTQKLCEQEKLSYKIQQQKLQRNCSVCHFGQRCFSWEKVDEIL